MGLLDTDIVEDLLHSSSISKGIERTMERMINELEIDSMYIIRYDSTVSNPEVEFDWDNRSVKRDIDLTEHLKKIEEWYHFDEDDMFIARATKVLPDEEREYYAKIGHQSVVEYQMNNHGNVIGYILIGWNRIHNLTNEEEDQLHVILKLLNERLIKQFNKGVMGDDWKLYRLAGNMARLLLYTIDEDYRICYANNYARDNYENISIGEPCYKAFHGLDAPCKNCILSGVEENEFTEHDTYLEYLEDSFHVCVTQTRAEENKKRYVMTLQAQQEVGPQKQRIMVGKKFIFALKNLYKDIIAVETRRDTYYNLFSNEMDNKHSYSMEFVLKWLSKVHLDDKQKFIECFDINFMQNEYLNGTKQKELDFRYRTHEGSYHCMNAKLIFEQNTRKDIVVYILFSNIEELRSAQIEEYRHVREALMAARSAAELKGEVLSNISREIRNPMSGIMSMSSVAKKVYRHEDKLLECLHNIDEYAEHMMQVMDSLLETVKVDPDSITIGKQPFRLESLLNKVDIAVREKIEKKNVQFHIQSQCQFKQLAGDEIRLQQALCALIQNSIEYTPVSGSITVSAKQMAVDKKTVYVRFMIDDTGNGLTDKMKESIFGFSHNAENGIINEEYFNLSLAARVIQLMGGFIGVDNSGAGTHLYFTLPFELVDEVQNKPSRKKTEEDDGRFKGKKILLAEDSEMGQDAIRAILEVVGFEVDTAENGRKAVIQFISQPAFTYDAVLMDVHMPFMDGREATKCIRISGKEDGESVPIIGLMTNTYDEDVEESLQAGMQAHLAKPVDVDTLYKVLRKLIPEEADEE